MIGHAPNDDAPATVETAGLRPTFSLATLLLLVTIFSFWLGLLVTFPYFAVGGLVMFAPAIARAVVAVRLLHRKGKVTTAGDKVTQLFASMIITYLTYIATAAIGLAALVLAEVTVKGIDAIINVSPDDVGWMNALMMVIAAIGVIFAILFGLWLFVKLWPKGKDFSG